MRGVAVVVSVVAPVVVTAACHSDHGALKKRDHEEGGAAGSVTVVGGTAGQGGTAGTPAVEPEEPVGDNVLTLVHGVVDAPRLHFCLTRLKDGSRGPAPGSPSPEGGLAFGEVLSLPSLPGLDPATDDFIVTVVAAEADEIEGLSCEEAIERARELAEAQPSLLPPLPPEVGGAGGQGEGSLAGAGGAGGIGGALVELIPPPAVRAHDLVSVPSGTLTKGRSTLLVARGCLGGGTTLTDAHQAEICGQGYGPVHPTVAPLFVALSRITAPERVGVQVVNATSASSTDETLTLKSLPLDGEAITIVRRVPAGSIAPRVPEFFAIDDLVGDSERDEATLQPLWGGASTPIFEQTWGYLRTQFDVDPIAADQDYALVVLGPSLRREHGSGWWAQPTIALLHPTR